MSVLLLRYIDFTVVEFDLVDADGHVLRPVVVRVGSGSTWRRAVRFPTVGGNDGMQSTGDGALDAHVRHRASEWLVVLAAAAREGAA